ncbi:hypothetical protein HZB08_01145, partial [Candidatus Saganbacteria bacterium]|nr:hypothetical protein [Candidatus Saganbacteria bacterium]
MNYAVSPVKDKKLLTTTALLSDAVSLSASNTYYHTATPDILIVASGIIDEKPPIEKKDPSETTDEKITRYLNNLGNEDKAARQEAKDGLLKLLEANVSTKKIISGLSAKLSDANETARESAALVINEFVYSKNIPLKSKRVIPVKPLLAALKDKNPVIRSA